MHRWVLVMVGLLAQALGRVLAMVLFTLICLVLGYILRQNLRKDKGENEDVRGLVLCEFVHGLDSRLLF